MAEDLEFYKITGAGNDFILGDNRHGRWAAHPLERLSRGLCRRALSVGADGLILIENSNRARFRIRIFNSDGTQTRMCGNGARCAARFAFLKVIAGRQMTMETPSGVLEAEILPNGAVRVEIPGLAENPRRLEITGGGRRIPCLLTHTGVPHAVVFVKDVEKVPVASLGALLRRAPELGAEGANVDFVSVEDGPPFPLRTFERGVEGETLACGTGVTAAAWVLRHLGRAGDRVEMRVRSGQVLAVEIDPSRVGKPLFRLTGEARVVYRGYLSQESLLEALA